MSTSSVNDRRTAGPPPTALIAFAWLWVLVPFVYGVYELVLKAKNLFG